MSTANLPVVRAEVAYRSQQIQENLRSGRSVRHDPRSMSSGRDLGPARWLGQLTHLVRPVTGVHGR